MRRILAAFIDTLLVLAVIAAIQGFYDKNALINLAVFIVYFAVQERFIHGSVGKIVFGLRIAYRESRVANIWASTVLRAILRLVCLFPLLGIPCLISQVWDRRGLSLLDKAVGSTVFDQSWQPYVVENPAHKAVLTAFLVLSPLMGLIALAIIVSAGLVSLELLRTLFVSS